MVINFLFGSGNCHYAYTPLTLLRLYRLPGPVGHFTQVMWRGSKQMGIARARAKSGAWYAVANYWPAGNMAEDNPLNISSPSDGKALEIHVDGTYPNYNTIVSSDKTGLPMIMKSSDRLFSNLYTYSIPRIWYRWLTVRLQYLHCKRNGDTSVLH